MSFNSIHFLVFFPIVTMLYFLIPFKIRWIWLLFSSYYFYMCWNPKYAILIGLSTIVTYLSGILIERTNNTVKDVKKAKDIKKLWIILSFVINLGILFLFKYYNFFTNIIVRLGTTIDFIIKFPNFDVLLPVGISFYTFQALSYTVDVYRGDIKAEKNLGKYALFVSFFPQLVAGPIEKSKKLLPQFNEVYEFDYYRVKNGLIKMLWGFFKKIFIADRLAILVNTVYNAPNEYFGFQFIIATLFFTFEIYCDFSSYSDIAIGSAQVMGFELSENFKQPYLAKSIKDFWKRWHITLSSWFRDYLYIPLGGNRKGKFRTYLNIMSVFLASGLWHGASLNFVIWGTLHGIYQVIGDIIKPIKNKIIHKYNIRTDIFSFKLSQILITFILVNFAWIFFRANSFSDIKIILNNLFVYNPWVLSDQSLYNLGLSSYEFIMAIIGIVIVIFMDNLQEKENLIEIFSTQNFVFRGAMYISVIIIICIFGVYGSGYSAQQFIYFQF
ncbi:MBOAT family O-acyltransferase [Clostridium aquiflavi]|uniref:MBOAT family O-acyltransferase n=1 Tax=Clostridium aquiflavi TaxID=3073603 RepID=A0ABU1EF38_9CLOT|nr:MBOAT family O-acyltransferase [Clostridium sp. 5N-1]MDR5586996.1 MBOAT family O-acyltransferase [Clostridium sp. 5N-1]